ncbi:MAG TPA: uracil-DNA glycosylase [Gemmataceae bacterium]|jgi:DNA polymerase|nr:uracil-DNA glycosylase [Gemmataceae bacterium]
MSDERPPMPAEVERQVRRHAESLRAAGVEWLPNAPLPPVERREAPPAPAAEAPTPALQPVLFSLGAEAAGGDLTPEQRCQELAALAQRVAACTRCAGLVVSRTQTVFGVGPLDPDLCFVGEAPGADEDAQGEPFVGQAGQLLNRIITACGMRREDVYICNILRCRPPGNRTPLPQEAANCREYLERTLELVRPKFLCALGASAAQNLLGTTLGIGKLRGRFHDYKGTPVLCTYHPAFLLPNRSPERKKDVWEDMKKLLARMGRPVPPR